MASEYPDITADTAYVDAMSLYMVQNPSAYDVLVMENQFGDILSDLGAGIVGGLGLGPSAEIGDEHTMFQPSHGTAPQLAGKNLANPIAMILSASMMLDWLAERHRDVATGQAATQIERAVARLLSDGKTRTVDLGGTAKTNDMKIRIRQDSSKKFYYPDLSLVYESNGQTESFQDRPVLIIEVLSKSTRAIDLDEKLEAYLTIESLMWYIMFEQHKPMAIMMRRTEHGFLRETVEGLDAAIELPTLGLQLPLSEVYAGVDFTPTAVHESELSYEIG